MVEDATQALLCSYNGEWCGTLGDLGCISFHETKNLQCGEGGALIAGNKNFFVRAKYQEKGTDRSRFLRGEVDKYTWQDVGSSYELSEINGSILRCQLEHAHEIMDDRRRSWELYHELLTPLARAVPSVSPTYPSIAFTTDTSTTSRPKTGRIATP